MSCQAKYFGYIFLVLLAIEALSFPLKSYKEFPGLKIELLNPLPILVESGETLTLRFLVTNLSSSPQVLIVQDYLPPGWQCPYLDNFLELREKQKEVILSSLFIPRTANAGKYQASFLFINQGTNQVEGKVDIELEVKPKLNLKWQLLSAPSYVLAGEEYSLQFFILNSGNTSVQITLKAESHPALPFSISAARFSLEPGEGKEIITKVKTKKDLAFKVKNWLMLAAMAQTENLEPAVFSTSAITEIFPSQVRKIEHDNIFFSGGTLWLCAEKEPASTQPYLLGKGYLNEKKSREFNLFLRGPAQERLRFFGYFPDEYRFNYQSSSTSFFLGDHTYSLTQLTQLGLYGRGIALGKNIGPVNLKSFWVQSPYFSPSGFSQGALQIELKPAPSSSLSLNLTKIISDQDAYLFSLAAWAKGSSSQFNFELAVDGSSLQKNIESIDYAFWSEFASRWRRLSVKTNLLYSTPHFSGFYKNLFLFFLSSAYAFGKNNFHISYSSAKQNRDGGLESPIFIDRQEENILAGLNFGLSTWLHFRFEVHSKQKNYKNSQSYEEKYFRLGLNGYQPRINFFSYLDLGRHRDNLFDDNRRFIATGISMNWNLSRKFYLGTSFRWRNIKFAQKDEEEKDRQYDFHLRADLGRTHLTLLHRTLIYQSWTAFLPSPLAWESYFLRDVSSYLELILEQLLFKGHSLKINLRYVTGATLLTKSRWATLLEYKIPLGSWQGPKKQASQISGQVFKLAKEKIPLAKARIILGNLEVLTDDKGRFIISGVQEGKHDLFLDLSSIRKNLIPAEPLPICLEIKSGESKRIDLALVKPAKIIGRLKWSTPTPSSLLSPAHLISKETGDLPLVLIELSNEKEVLFQKANKEGIFSFDSLRPGSWQLKVKRDSLPQNLSLEPETVQVDLTPGEEKEFIFYLSPRQPQINYLGEIKVDMISEQAFSDSSPSPDMRNSTVLESNFVQLGAFRLKENAARFQKTIQKDFEETAIIETKYQNQILYRVGLIAKDLDMAKKRFELAAAKGYKGFLQLTTTSSGLGPTDSKLVILQIAAFEDKNKASALIEKLKEKYDSVTVSIYRHNKKTFFRVQIWVPEDQVEKVSQELKKDGYNFWILAALHDNQVQNKEP